MADEQPQEQPQAGESLDLVDSHDPKATEPATDPEATDPELLKENSEIRTYTTSRYTYAGIRVFYKRHSKADQLPKPPLPLLVFIHGLGGSVAQFHPLLKSLVHMSSCLAIDLPGCGRSDFTETAWEAYTPQALVELLEIIIDEYRQKEHNRNVVLVGHSMGTALCARLASRSTLHKTQLQKHIVGLVAICPMGKPPGLLKSLILKAMLSLPERYFDRYRAYDSKGGLYSASVSRFVGSSADDELRLLQYRFNKQSRTPVFRRMAWGFIVPTFENWTVKYGVPGRDVWSGVDVPVYLVGGKGDHITKPEEVSVVEDFLSGETPPSPDTGDDNAEIGEDTTALVDRSKDSADQMAESIDDLRDEDFQRDKRVNEEADDDPSTPQESPANVPPQPRHPTKVVKSIVLPRPANHALLFMPSTVRTLAGLVSDFLIEHVTGRYSLAWQLQYLSREGKWDVKNLKKWEGVVPVSHPIGPRGKPPIFRAMKTLREADNLHSPAAFVEKWGAVIKNVVDISHDQPVYDPRTMEKAGVHYRKFATVSKIPPTEAEVATFNSIIDELREEQKARAKAEGWQDVDGSSQVIGVHCHYGFNRTGYFLVCYLVDRCGVDVQEAIDIFAKARPNGIRHDHFLDRLHLRKAGLTSE